MVGTESISRVDRRSWKEKRGGGVIPGNSNRKLHNADHLFDERNPEVYTTIEGWLTYILFKSNPSGKAEFEREILQVRAKLRVFEEALLFAIIQAVKEGSPDPGTTKIVQGAKDDITEAWSELPGHSYRHRKTFLRALFLDPALNPKLGEVKELAEAAESFNEELSSGTQAYPPIKSELIFSMLVNYFGGDLSEAFFVYPKLVIKSRTDIAVRFYVSKRAEVHHLIANVLPVEIIRAWRGLPEGKKDWGLRCLQYFLSKHRNLDSGNRLQRLLNQFSGGKRVSKHRPLFTLSMRDLIKEDISIRVEDNKRLVKGKKLFALHGIDEYKVGVRKLIFGSSSAEHSTVVNEKVEIGDSGVFYSDLFPFSKEFEYPEGWVTLRDGLNSTQAINYTHHFALRHNHFEEEKRYTDIALRYYSDFISISAVRVRLSGKGKKYVNEILGEN